MKKRRNRANIIGEHESLLIANVSNYPRPQLRRESWKSLDGSWKFAFDDDRLYNFPQQIKNWSHTIEVPFAPESKKSGIHDQGFHECFWYEKEFDLAPSEGHTLIHFGAVDYEARVWFNDQFVGSHEGGHTSFTFDVTAQMNPSGKQKLAVCAVDNPHDLAKPRGKQDWQLEPHSIWYPRTSGIWQTVWVEQVPEYYVQNIRWTPHLEAWEVGCEIFLNEDPLPTEEISATVRLTLDEHILAEDTYRLLGRDIYRRIAFPDPGIDDYRNEILWSPESPTLIRAQITIKKNGVVTDSVDSYTALRSVAAKRDHFLLNGRPYYMRLILDQGYWPDTLMTAPSTEALRADIEIAKAMGFNGARKHQKIEDPRYLFWADVLGFLVWEELPSAYRFTPTAVARLTKEWTEAIDRDFSHPCIAVWVPFNESWGVPDLAEKQVHRSCVQALYYLTKTLDPTRPVIGNDGWESIATDIIGIHDYDKSPEHLKGRYGPEIKISDLLERRIPAAGKLMSLEEYKHQGQPLVLSEFGGIAFAKNKKKGEAWGYMACKTAEELQEKYIALLETVKRLEIFCGFCYTQFTDTFQEANGLLYADRTPKFPLEIIHQATNKSGFTVEEVALKDYPYSQPTLDI